MDIHRCRFVPYPSSAINALAFTHKSTPTLQGKGPRNLRLAIGRANGDIELWNPLRGAWYQESIFRGGKDRSIEGLVWTQDPEDVDKSGYRTAGKLRLFSIGYSTAVTEWDLASGRPARHSAGNYGEIWCLAAQPRCQPRITARNISQDQEKNEDAESQFQKIAVGCADGAIVLLDTADGDLRFSRLLARSSKRKSRVLSITFQNSSTIIAGHADSTIRIYDIRNNQQMRSMTLGAGPKGGPQEILVWSVKCLGTDTIVSGDSTGTMSFWDGKNYTLLQRIKSHEADILDIAVSADSETVFSGGMDRRTTQYRRTGNGRPGEKVRWAKIAHQRFHKHDVKAMAPYETKDLSILASGGLDTAPIIIPIQEFGREHHRTLSILPHRPALRSAPRKRLVASWWDHEISIWRMPRSQSGNSGKEDYSEAGGVGNGKLIAKIALQGEESITSIDLSLQGDILAVSTMADLKFFRLRPKLGSLKVRKLEAPIEIIRKGARSVHISPDQKWLALVRADNLIHLHRIMPDEDSKRGFRVLSKVIILKRLPRDPTISGFQNGTLGNYDRSINRLSFSADSRILAATDLSGFLDTWVLEGREDLTLNSGGKAESAEPPQSSADEGSDVESDEEEQAIVILGQHWLRNPAASLLIKLPATPLVVSFRPLSKKAAAALTNGSLGVHPTRHTPYPHSHDLPNGEDRLFVLTAENQMYEFNVLSGRISDWSRRNPPSSLPKDFQGVRDRAMGAVWDVGAQRERIWLYGVSWLWMFDLSKDMPAPEDQDGKSLVTNGGDGTKQLKRKRAFENEDDESIARPRTDTGAGSKIPNSKLELGIGPEVRKFKGTEKVAMQLVDVEREQHPASEEDGDTVLANENDSTLISLRRTAREADDLDVDEEATGSEGKHFGTPSHWHTFKYRPILGIVPLGGESDDDDSSGQLNGAHKYSRSDFEAALVERPLWEVDLPPRYYGNQEWTS